MKKNINILILLIIGLIFCLIPLFCGKLFGSNIDWINQHVAFADYFRNLFYKTGNILPDIAWNIGLGQNIYNFSYYGLLSPIILISYFFPFVSMYNYIIISNIILYLLSIYLFNKWTNAKYDKKVSILVTVIFMLSGPLFYHFHRQFMFVNYMPFLLLSLIEIDKDKKNSLILITLYMTLMIFTSYYYSVGGILCITIYYVYVHFQDSLKTKLKILNSIIISILLSGIILIPTILTIISSRNDITTSINLISLFIPDFSIGNSIYGSYTLGLTSFLIPSLIALIINKNKKFKYLGVLLAILILFPLFRYLLNGGLYIRSKALIPFLPLYIYIIGLFVDDLVNKKVNYKLVINITLIISLFSLISGYFNIGFYLDIFLTVIIILWFKNKRSLLAGLILIIEMFIMFIVFNLDEDYVTKEDYTKLNSYQEQVDNIIKNDNSIYRIADTTNVISTINSIKNINHYSISLYSSTYNSNYYKLYHDILNTNNETYNHLMLSDTNNIIVNRLLGVKYVITRDKLKFGYSLVNNVNGYYLYKNDYALPLGYATNKIYNLDNFNNLEYPYNLEALLTGIIVNNGNYFSSNYTSLFTSDYSISIQDNISISTSDEYTLIHVMDDSSINVTFKEEINDKLLFIEVKGLEANKCNNELSMEINGVKNKLTCAEWNYPNKNNTFHFLISDNNISTLDIKLSKGIYKVTDLKVYIMDKDVLQENFDIMDNIQIIGNSLLGDIDVSSDGYMVLSVPYDDNFIVKVDNNIVDYECVNNGFIGFSMKSGYHNVEIIYQNYDKYVGIVTSLFGLFIYFVYFLVNTRKKIKQ